MLKKEQWTEIQYKIKIIVSCIKEILQISDFQVLINTQGIAKQLFVVIFGRNQYNL